MTTFANPGKWLLDLFGTSSGKVKVTARSSLQTAPFWYGVNRISGNIGTMPLNVYRRLPDGGSEKATNHWANRLLRGRPNAYQTPMVFKQTLTAQAILWGNGAAYIHRAGNQSELIPLRPDRTFAGLIKGDSGPGEKWFLTMPESTDRESDRLLRFDDLLDEMERNPRKCVMIPDRDVLHIQGFGDGVNGMSLFQMARNTIAITLGGNDRSEKAMNKGFAGKVMLEAPPESMMFKDAKKAEEFLKDFNEKHGSDASADQVGLLLGGIKANVLAMSNKDAEFVEQMKFQREEAALFLMLESILGTNNSVSYNSEEQKSLAYLKHCLTNWLTRWEEECSFKLLSNREFYSGDYYCKFNTASLLRTDLATTASTFSTLITSLVLSPNEARAKLDMNPYEGGDTFQNPNTSTTANNDEPNAAVVSRLEHLLGVEAKRVNEFLASGASYEKIDKWYEGWCTTLGDAIESLGGDRLIAQKHCVDNLTFIKKNPSHFDLSGSAELLAKEIENV